MKRWTSIGLAALIAAGGAAYYVTKKKKTGDVEMKSGTVSRGKVAVTIQATGVVEPQNRVEIKPPIAGRAEEILVREGETVRKGQVVAWMSSSERAALVDAARAKGAEELKHWEDLYKPAPLVAPLSGVVIARNVEPGQTLTAQDAVLVMSNRLIVKAQVDETDIGQVKIGQPAVIGLDAYARDQIDGKVDHIAFEAKTVNNVTIYEVEVAPAKVTDFMRSGMTANVSFRISEKEDALVVPAEAVIAGERGSFVLVPGAEGKPDRRKVTTGLSNGKDTEIIDGLAEGETYLVRTVRLEGGKGRSGSNPMSPFGGGRRQGGGTRR